MPARFCDDLIIKRALFLKVGIFSLKLIYRHSYHLMPNLCSLLNDMLIKIAIWRVSQRCQSVQSKPVLVQQGGKL